MTFRCHRRRSVAAILLLSTIVVGPAGCRLAGSTEPTPKPEPTAARAESPKPTSTPTSVPDLRSPGPRKPTDPRVTESPCIQISFVGEPIPPTIANAADFSDIVVVGTLVGYGPDRWSTADGHRPTWNEVRSDGLSIVRPVSIAVERTLRGDSTTLGSVFVLGGRVGCDTFSVSDPLDAAVGTRAVYYLGTTTDGPSLLEAWAITADDMVVTPLDGLVPLQEIVDSLGNGATQTPGAQSPSP